MEHLFDPTETRQGIELGVMRYVLAISLFGVVFGLGLVAVFV